MRMAATLLPVDIKIIIKKIMVLKNHSNAGYHGLKDGRNDEENQDNHASSRYKNFC